MSNIHKYNKESIVCLSVRAVGENFASIYIFAMNALQSVRVHKIAKNVDFTRVRNT